MAATTAQMTSPAAGAKFSGSSVTFTWSAGTSATAYWLYLGTTGAKSANIFSSGSITGTSATVTGIPSNGVTVYATLFSEVAGAWQPTAYTYTEAGTIVLAGLTSPAAGTALGPGPVTFTWSAGNGPTAYVLYLGTTGAKSSNLYNSGTLTAKSVTVSNLPTYGVKIYATLYSMINGVWEPISAVYEESGTPVLAALTGPVSGSTLSGSSVTFSWTAGGGPTAYWLYLGTTGARSTNVYSSGSITGTSITVKVPTNGVALYATLYSEVSGTWQPQPVSYTFTEAGSPVLAALSSPAAGATLPGSSATFTWAKGGGPTADWLYLGTNGPNSANLYSSGATDNTSATVSGLPVTGATIYATLFSQIEGVYQPVHYTFKEALPPAPAIIISPAASSTLSGSSVTFTWTPGSQAQGYWLYLGTTGAQSVNLYNAAVSGTSVTVSVPANGVNLYATLFTKLNGTFTPVNYTFTEAGTPVLAAMTSPSPSSTFAGSAETFTWTPGAGPTAYDLYLGTTGPGSANLYNSGTLTGTSATVNGLPTTGAKVYVTLFSKINGAWQPVHYTYSEPDVAYKVQLNWNAVTGVTPSVEGYNVFRITSGVSGTQQLTQALDTQTEYIDTTVAAGVTYSYYVTSVNTAKEASAPSSTFTITVP